MPSNSEVGITLKAKTDEFELKLKKAVGAFENLAQKGADVSRSVDTSMKKLTIVSKNSVNEIERAFNSLSIKSDMSLTNQTKALAQNAKFFEKQYQKIATDANSSAAEVTRAYTAMNDKIRQLNEQPLKKSFSTLGIMPESAVEAQKARVISAYNEIKNSGTASAKDIKNAEAAMNRELARTEDQVKRNTKGFDVMSLASVAAIAKIQVVYSLVNTTMSVMSQIPGTMMSAVEDFNAAAISNAAVITSLQRSTRDVGERYKENKRYAEAVQEVLIKMDAQTAASGMNLTDMNRKFTEQGVLIDVNNKKQIAGALAIANAISALNSGASNLNQQFSQEVDAIFRGSLRPGDKLAKFLDAQLGGNLKEQLETWKKISIEQNNSGLILEKLLPLLQGFDAAQGDINALWETTKSTLDTIYKETLREGFGPEFEIIVGKMKEFGEYASENKHKIAEMMQAGFSGANEVISFITEYGKGIAAVGTFLVAAKTAQFAFNVLVKANPYMLAVTGLIALNEWLEKYDLNISSIITKTEKLGTSLATKVRDDKIQSLGKQIDALNESLRTGVAVGEKWYNFTLLGGPSAKKTNIEKTRAEVKKLQSEYDKLIGKEEQYSLMSAHKGTERFSMMSSHNVIDSGSSVPGEIGTDDGLAEEKAFLKEVEDDVIKLAEEWNKTRVSLEREVGLLGLNDFEKKIANIKNEAIDLRNKFGDRPEIDIYESAAISAEQEANFLKEVAEEVKNVADEKKKLNKLNEEYRDVVISTMSDEQQAMEAVKASYAEKRSIVEKMVAEGLDASEAERISLILVANEAEDVKKAFMSMSDKGVETSELMKDAFSGWANNMSSTFTDVVWGADLSFKSILESFGKMLTQMVIQAMIVKPLVQSITGMFGTVGDSSSTWQNPDTGTAWVPSAKGNAFSGISGYSSQVVSSPTLFKHGGVTAFASGGGVMGEAGPEAIMPLSRTPSGKLGVEAIGGGSTTNVIIHNNSKGEVKVDEIKNASGGKDITVMIEEVVGKSIRSGKGTINRAMRSAFGASHVVAGR